MHDFGALAAERIHAGPLRYYVWLPALRIADMWLRPRTELFPSDPRWWEFNDDRRWLAVSLGFGLINLVYVALAAAGLVFSRKFFGIGLFVLFLVLRSVFLGTLENPEPRYTLECYPAVIVLASVLLSSACINIGRYCETVQTFTLEHLCVACSCTIAPHQGSPRVSAVSNSWAKT